METQDKCVMPTVKHGGGNVIVWGCMNAAGVGELYFIEGNINSNMAPHGKELSEDLKRRIVALHVDGQGYKKIANTLKLSCSTVAKIIQRFKRIKPERPMISTFSSLATLRIFSHGTITPRSMIS